MCTDGHACMAGKGDYNQIKNELYEIIHELESLKLSTAKFSQKRK